MIVTDYTDRSLAGLLPSIPRFEFYDPAAIVVPVALSVEAIMAQEYMLPYVSDPEFNYGNWQFAKYMFESKKPWWWQAW